MKKFILSLLIGYSIPAAFAQGSHTGGGDQCKNEIDKHRREILAWIERDEASEMDFSQAKIAGLSYLGSMTGPSYKKSMLAVLQEGKVIVNCYLDPARLSDRDAEKIARNEGVSYRNVSISGQPSTCINYEDQQLVSHIDCNYDLVMNENSLGNSNFRNTHHEFASIAGMEIRASAPSDMSLSDQLSQFERTVSIKQLGPKLKSASRPSTRVTHLALEVDGISVSEKKPWGESKAHRKIRRSFDEAIQESSEILEAASSCNSPVALSVQIKSAAQLMERSDAFGRRSLVYRKPSLLLYQGGVVVSRTAAETDDLNSLLSAAHELISNHCMPAESTSSGASFKFGVWAKDERAKAIMGIAQSAELNEFRNQHSCTPKFEFKSAINSVTEFCDLNGQNCSIVANTDIVLVCGGLSKTTQISAGHLGTEETKTLLRDFDLK